MLHAIPDRRPAGGAAREVLACFEAPDAHTRRPEAMIDGRAGVRRVVDVHIDPAAPAPAS